MQQKIQKTSSVSSKIALELVALSSRFYRKRILVIAGSYVNRRSQDFRHYQDRHFRTEVPSQSRKNLIKLLPFRFQQFLLPCNMLTVQGRTEK